MDHCIMDILNYTVYNVHYTILHCTVYILHFIVYNVHYTVYILHCIVYLRQWEYCGHEFKIGHILSIAIIS